MSAWKEDGARYGHDVKLIEQELEKQRRKNMHTITKDIALSANEFHYGLCEKVIGPRGRVTYRIETWRRSGKTQTWKTRPSDFRVPVKHGLYTYGEVTHHNANEFHASENCPLHDEEGFNK